MTVAGRDLPAANRGAFEANLERFDVHPTVFEGDTLELLRGGVLNGRKVGVFYYDACHDYEPQVEALRLSSRSWPTEALLIVDDSDWEEVHRAVDDYLAQQPRARLLAEVAGAGGDQDWWWDGMAVLAWTRAQRNKPERRPAPDVRHSSRSNQWEPRSASTTFGSVCGA